MEQAENFEEYSETISQNKVIYFSYSYHPQNRVMVAENAVPHGSKND